MPRKTIKPITLNNEQKIFKEILAKIKTKSPAVVIKDKSILMYIDAETKSGAVISKEKIPSKFTDRKINESKTMTEIPWEKLPKWVQYEFDCTRKNDRDTTLKHLLTILKKEPTEQNVQPALMVANEIGRFEDGGEFLLKNISPKLINEIIHRKE